MDELSCVECSERFKVRVQLWWCPSQRARYKFIQDEFWWLRKRHGTLQTIWGRRVALRLVVLGFQVIDK
jgi:hypothetical protein